MEVIIYFLQMRNMNSRIFIQQPIHFLESFHSASWQIFLVCKDCLKNISFPLSWHCKDREASIVDERECHRNSFWWWLRRIRNVRNETVSDLKQRVIWEERSSVTIRSNSEQQQVERRNSCWFWKLFSNQSFIIFCYLLDWIVDIDRYELLLSQRNFRQEIFFVESKKGSKLQWLENYEFCIFFSPESWFHVILWNISLIAKEDSPLTPVCGNVGKCLTQIFTQRASFK